MTGKNVTGGAWPDPPETLNSQQVVSAVNYLTNNNSSSFLALFNAPGTGPKDGHWVLVQGFDLAGNVKILDPTGLSYTMRPADFQSAWVYGGLVKNGR
ncbi:hypothetical protein LJR290_003483 [Variovorax sp. LjRoot290]|uniref:hypothetical protein n=1 Tax=Variovorax sp. LjRoot290 TaxID=3342316 RepID=UPI003ECEA080